MSQHQGATLTHHALLIAWGQFAQCIKLVEKLEAVSLKQKTVDHSPQRKVIEFFVAIVGGLAYLKDISCAAHPLDQDPAVAQAWGQAGWADHSGVSRTLTALKMEEAQQIVEGLHQVSQTFIDQEVLLALRAHGKLVYDGDLTGRPVSNTSTTYPDVAYGHMSNAIELGYQAALVSLHSPTYGRQWLSVAQHPGNTLACSQAETMVRAAEATTGVRPRRRTELLQERLGQAKTDRQQRATQVQQAEAGAGSPMRATGNASPVGRLAGAGDALRSRLSSTRTPGTAPQSSGESPEESRSLPAPASPPRGPGGT